MLSAFQRRSPISLWSYEIERAFWAFIEKEVELEV
jgi:hypothetical protein